MSEYEFSDTSSDSGISTDSSPVSEYTVPSPPHEENWHERTDPTRMPYWGLNHDLAPPFSDEDSGDEDLPPPVRAGRTPEPPDSPTPPRQTDSPQLLSHHLYVGDPSTLELINEFYTWCKADSLRKGLSYKKTPFMLLTEYLADKE